MGLGDSHETSQTGEKFHLWGTKLTALVKIPDPSANVNLPVPANAKAFEDGGCGPVYLQDIELTGTWLGENIILVRVDSLERAALFAVSVNGGRFKKSLIPRVRTSCRLWESLCVESAAKVIIKMDETEVGQE